MEKTIKIGGNDIQIRGLKWREVQELKGKGYNLSWLDPTADNDELVLITIEKACGNTGFIEKLDLDAIEVYRIFKEIHKLTYVGEPESKN